MTIVDKPRAIRATFADWRPVKTRKVLQLIMEVPLEQTQEVLEMLGAPLPDHDTWVAVALLDTSPKAVVCNTLVKSEKADAEQEARALREQPIKRADPINSMTDLKAALIASLEMDNSDVKVENEGTKNEPLRAHLSVVGKQRYAAASDMERARIDCVMRCKDPRFWRWADLYRGRMAVHDEESAAEFVRDTLGIQSRSEIAKDHEICREWQLLETRFLADTGMMAESR